MAPPIAFLQIGVVEDDQRRFSAEFHRRVLHQRTGQRQHLAAGRHRSGHRNLGDRLVAGEGRADIAETLHDIEDAVRQAGFANRSRPAPAPSAACFPTA